jgi:hypothetical protein
LGGPFFLREAPSSGTAGSPFIRIDGSETPSGRPAARDLSNLFLAQEPFPGLDPFETTRIPFDALKIAQRRRAAVAGDLPECRSDRRVHRPDTRAHRRQR